MKDHLRWVAEQTKTNPPISSTFYSDSRIAACPCIAGNIRQTADHCAGLLASRFRLPSCQSQLHFVAHIFVRLDRQ